MVKKRYILLVTIILITIYFGYYNRSFYTNEKGRSFTIWRPLGANSYLIDGIYLNPLKPRENYMKLYSSKYMYFCENAGEKITLNIGSKIITKKGLEDYLDLTHDEFFKRFTGQSYENGEFIVDDSAAYKKNHYKIHYIELGLLNRLYFDN